MNPDKSGQEILYEEVSVFSRDIIAFNGVLSREDY